jgi:hypothetical protein
MPGERAAPRVDVTMLAVRCGSKEANDANAHYAQFASMLTSGFALLVDVPDPLHGWTHATLRPHLVPALWTLVDGALAALDYVKHGGRGS